MRGREEPERLVVVLALVAGGVALVSGAVAALFATWAGRGLEPGWLASPAFDWGLPFHLGRRVYTVFEARSTPFGSGPFVAF